MTQPNIFGDEATDEVPTPRSTKRWTRPPDFNPCVAFYGPGPKGATCRRCAHLLRFGRYLKCDLRTMTNGPATDHRAALAACARYEEAVR